jgi:hypothetical protein
MTLIDERFLMHRLRSTSIGGLAGVLVAGGLFFYHFFTQHKIAWELFAIIATVAVVKIAVLIWYRMTD